MGRGLRLVGATVLVWLAVAGLFVLVVGAARSGEGGGGLFGPRVAVVELEGIITDVDDVVRELKAHRENPSVRAIVMRINSPGGTVSASDLMYDEVKRFKQITNKPVVASAQDIAASGAYYVACSADKIVVQPTSVIGSIGVESVAPGARPLNNVDTTTKSPRFGS